MNAPFVISDHVSANQGRVSGHGSVAMTLLQNGFDLNALRPCTDAGPYRANATLRRDEWIQYDQALIEVARHRLGAVTDLMSRGLTYNLNNALGKTRIEWESSSDMTGAEISMSGISQSQNDRIQFDLESLPVPIIHKEFNINLRVLEASRTTGDPLDTMQAEIAGRKVSETIEGMLFNGATVLGSNNPIYGYRTAPNRITGAVSAAWETATGEQIVDDIQRMIDVAQADDNNMFGPFVFYVSNSAMTHFGADYKANSDKTIMSRIREIPGLADIKGSYYMPRGEVVMVQMTRDVIDMVDGIQPTSLQWDSHAGFIVHFKVLAIMIPRVKSTYENQSGIIHFTAQ